MRRSHGLCWQVMALACLVHHTHAQAIRGTVVDASGQPVSGVVLQLMDSSGASLARGLSAANGEYRLSAPRAGIYTVRSLRIGFRPTVSTVFELGTGATLTQQLVLANIAVQLTGMQATARSACKMPADSGASTYRVWEQIRTALLATELTQTSHNILATVVAHERSLDANGRHVNKQSSNVQTAVVAKPWEEAAPDVLHAKGYVERPDDGSVTYYAPGITVLTSTSFLEDHCFRLQAESERIGLVFQPNDDRRTKEEVRGTMWIDRASSQLRSVEYSYANVPRDYDAPAGGTLEFARLNDGAWAISRWEIRMPIFERTEPSRLASRNTSSSPVHLAEMLSQGAELVLAKRGADTLFSQPPRVLRGILRDSVAGTPLGAARVALKGTLLNGVSDERGRFNISGALPGVYTLQIRTPSLDSVSAVHESDVEFLGDDKEREYRVPTGVQILANVCPSSAKKADFAGVLLGGLRMAGGAAAPRDVRVSAQWNAINERGGGVKRLIEARTTADGRFALCGVPANTDLYVEAESDSGYASAVMARLAPGGRLARTELNFTRVTGNAASFTGIVSSEPSSIGLADAEIIVGDGVRATRSDENGAYRVSGIAAGPQHVSVRKIGYMNLDTTFTFVPGQVLRRNIGLGRVVQLAERNTRASYLPPSFDENRKVGLGAFFTRAQLDSAGQRPLASLLTQVRGVLLKFGSGRGAFLTTTHRGQCISKNCPSDYVSVGGERRCASAVYLDNLLLNNENPPQPVNLREYNLDQMEAIEWYASSAETPMQYQGLNKACGVLVMHTRKSP